MAENQAKATLQTAPEALMTLGRTTPAFAHFNNGALITVSQDTTNVGAIGAFEDLPEVFRIALGVLGNARASPKEQFLPVTGLFENKVRTSDASQTILNRLLDVLALALPRLSFGEGPRRWIWLINIRLGQE